MSVPILYSLQHCPFAMRARMALLMSKQDVMLRAIVTKDKPREMLKISPKGTVPILIFENGNQKYKSICEIRDFYLWFDAERKKQGHEIKAAGIAAIVANQFSKLDNAFIRFFIIRNKEVLNFTF